MTKYAKLTSGLILAWFLFSVAASARHVYVNAPNSPPIAIGLAASIPIALFLLWFGASAQFRQFTKSLSPRVLTLVHSWRIGGFVFLILYARHALPGLFALPAGLGDMLIGATASTVAVRWAKPEGRNFFIAWQVLGIADLVIAVGMGTLSGFIQPQGVSTGAMTVLPLSLIPTFAVPILLILHIVCIAGAREWTVRKTSVSVQNLQSPAA
jgi:hypothetical protein